jgi:hypothetical protein
MEMIERAREQAEQERATIEAARVLAQDLALRSANLEREADEAAQVLAGALSVPGAEWRRDLDVVVTGRDAQQAQNDPVLVRYRVDRGVSRLARPLAKVLSSVARGKADVPVEGASETDLLPLAKAVVRTFAATGGKPESLVPLTRSAVSSLVEHLLDLATAPPQRGRAEGRATELEAIAEGLR